MSRIISALGTAMVVAGVALIVYVGIQYRDGSVTPPTDTPHWSAAQAKQGKQIAATFVHRQTLKVPVAKEQRVSNHGRERANRMIIPRIAVDAPVVETPPVHGVWEVADWKIGHLTTTPYPGAQGNAAFSAHDDIKGEIFKRVGELKPGDAVIVKTAHATYRYVVTKQSVVDPSDLRPLAPTAVPSLTLISCTPYWVDTQRLVTRAVLKSGSVS